MRFSNYKLCLAVEDLEENICQLHKVFEDGQSRCSAGLVKPHYYKYVYELVHSTELVKNDLSQKLSRNCSDFEILLQLYDTVCALESKLYSLMCIKPKYCSRDSNFKTFKISHEEDCDRICPYQRKTVTTRSSQTSHDYVSDESSTECSTGSSGETFDSGNYSTSYTEYGDNLPTDEREYNKSKSPARRYIEVRKSKNNQFNKKSKQKHFKYTPKQVKIEQSDTFVIRESKTKPKKHKSQSYGQLSDFGIAKSKSANFGVYSTKDRSQRKRQTNKNGGIKRRLANLGDYFKKRKPRNKRQSNKFDVRKSLSAYSDGNSSKKSLQESQIYFVRWTNGNPKDMFGRKIRNPSKEKYYISRLKRFRSISKDAFDIDSNNLSNASYDMNTKHKANKTKKSKHMKYKNNKQYRYSNNTSNSNTKSESVNEDEKWKNRMNKNIFYDKGNVFHAKQQILARPIKLSDDSDVTVVPSDYIVQYYSSYNSSNEDMHSQNNTHSLNYLKNRNKYSRRKYKAETHNAESSPSHVSKYEVVGSHYDINHYTHLKPSQLQSYGFNNKSQNKPTKIYSVIHKHQSLDIKSKAKPSPKRKNDLDYTILSSLTANENNPFNDSFHQKENKKQQQKRKLKLNNNKMGKLSSEMSLELNKHLSEVNNQAREFKVKKSNESAEKNTSVKHLSPDKTKLHSEENLPMKSPKDVISEPVSNGGKTDKDMTGPVSFPTPHINDPTKEEMETKFSKPPLTKNQEHLLYSLQFSREKKRRANVSCLPSTLSLVDILTSKCKPLLCTDELHLSEHKFNGAEVHNRVHKCFNHLEGIQSARCKKEENLISKSQQDMKMRTSDILRSRKNTHFRKSVQSISEFSSLDWKTVVQEIKEYR